MVALGSFQPIELAENVLLLIRWNAGPGIPNLDAQLVAAASAAYQYAAARCVTDGVLDQIADDLCEHNGVASDPRVARHDVQRQILFARPARERGFDAA